MARISTLDIHINLSVHIRRVFQLVPIEFKSGSSHVKRTIVSF